MNETLTDGDDYPELDPTGLIDLNQLEINLQLTPAQRVRQLQSFLNFAASARRARVKRYGYDPAAPADTDAAE